MYPTYPRRPRQRQHGLERGPDDAGRGLPGPGYRCGAFISAFVVDGRWGLKQGFELYDDQLDMGQRKHIDLGAIQRPGNAVMDAALAWLDGPQGRAVLLLDPPLRSPHALRAARTLPVRVRRPRPGRPLRRRGGLHGRADRPPLRLAGAHRPRPNRPSSSSSATTARAWAATARAPTAISSTITPSTFRSSSSRPCPGSGRNGWPRRSARSTSFRPSSSWPGSPGSRDPRAARSCRRSASPAPAPTSPPTRSPWPRASSSAGAPSGSCGRPATSTSTRRRPSSSTSPAIPARPRTCSPNTPDVVRDMKSELDELVERTERGAPTPQAANLDKDTMERLSALGYVGTPVAARKASGARRAARPIPRTSSLVFQKVTTAGELVTGEKYAEAMPLLESALAEEPGIPQALLVLATCYKETGRTEEAKSTLDLLLKADPENVQGLIGLANILIDEGRNEDVVALCKQALSVDEKNTQALLLIGEVYMGELDFGQALPYFERAARPPAQGRPDPLQPGRLPDRPEAVRPGRAGPARGPRGLPEVAAGPLQPGPAPRGAGPARGRAGRLCPRSRDLPRRIQGPLQPGQGPVQARRPGRIARGDARGRQAHAEAGRGASLPGPGPPLRGRPRSTRSRPRSTRGWPWPRPPSSRPWAIS